MTVRAVAGYTVATYGFVMYQEARAKAAAAAAAAVFGNGLGASRDGRRRRRNRRGGSVWSAATR